MFFKKTKFYQRLNNNWNAEPNAPSPIITIDYHDVYLEFHLNHFVYEQFEEDQKGILAFRDVHKLSFNSMNDEGYYMGQYRYSNEKLKHYIFFFRDNTFECVAKSFEFQIQPT